MRLSLFFFLTVLCFSQLATAKTPVILRVKSEEQTDTLGVNIVREITSIAYDAIKSGKVQLWDSPKKEVPISFNSLMEIEKNAGVAFKDQQLIYVYEIWNKEKKKLVSQTQGFLFSIKMSNGEAVVFGYVDYESLKNNIATALPFINANGDCYLNLNNVISKKNYSYQILQFGEKVINNVNESKLLKENYIANASFNSNPLVVDSVEAKYVEFTITDSEKFTGSKAKSSRAFINSLTDYFHQNLEVLYNLSGKNAESILQNGTWKISSVTFAEIWKKKDSDITTSPLWMSVNIDSSVIDTIYMDNLVNWDFKINEIEWLEFLKQKDYLYLITKINSEAIPVENAIKYQKGLLTHKWNNLINFVEHY
jgi:hypothetical protein